MIKTKKRLALAKRFFLCRKSPRIFTFNIKNLTFNIEYATF